MRAFWRLNEERSHIITGFAAPMGAMVLKPKPQRIPWSAIVRWCEWHGLPPQEAAFLDRCISALDTEFLAWWTWKEGQRGTS
ncbi:hypothetical protein HMPREF9946_02163 [Acetobacteraceae bacterium AT-5844]|nr:hypothetical protein HMPREF9946_02163 [Acetobacteraceae bacterium AT-5844]